MRKKYGRIGMTDTEFELRVVFEKEVLGCKIPEFQPVLQKALSDKIISEGLFISFLLGNCIAVEEIKIKNNLSTNFKKRCEVKKDE